MEQLQRMGFSRAASALALEKCNQDVDRAVEDLLLQSTEAPAAVVVGEGGAQHNATFVADDTLSDGSCVPVGNVISKRWIVHNPGPRAWPSETAVEFIRGSEHMPATATRFSVGPVPVGANAVVAVELEPCRPTTNQAANCVWRLTTAAGAQHFGDELWCELKIYGQVDDFGTSMAIQPSVDSAGATSLPVTDNSGSELEATCARLEETNTQLQRELQDVKRYSEVERIASKATLARAESITEQAKSAAIELKVKNKHLARELEKERQAQTACGQRNAEELAQLKAQLTSRLNEERDAAGRGEELATQLRSAHEQRDFEFAQQATQHAMQLAEAKVLFEAEVSKMEAGALRSSLELEALRSELVNVKAQLAAQATSTSLNVGASKASELVDAAPDASAERPPTALAELKVKVMRHLSRTDPNSYTGIGKSHIVYEINLQCHDDAWTVLRRYSEFAQLAQQLDTWITAQGTVPTRVTQSAQLPAKQWGLFAPSEDFLVDRRTGLENYLAQFIAETEQQPVSPFYSTSKEAIQKALPFFREEQEADAPEASSVTSPLCLPETASDPAEVSSQPAEGTDAVVDTAFSTGGESNVGTDADAESAEDGEAKPSKAEPEQGSAKGWFW